MTSLSLLRQYATQAFQYLPCCGLALPSLCPAAARRALAPYGLTAEGVRHANAALLVKHTRKGLLLGHESIEDRQEFGDDVPLAHLDIVEHDGRRVRVEWE